MAATRRLFIGMAPPIHVAEDLQSAVLGSFAPLDAARLRFTSARDLHLTLLFLGEVDERAIPALEAAMERALENGAAIELEIAGTGAFPSSARPRILWAGVKVVEGEESALEEMRRDLTREVREAGVGFSAHDAEGPFQPHLTLARVRSPLGENAAKAFYQIDFRSRWRADEAVLFQSGGPAVEEVESAGASPARHYRRLHWISLAEGT